MTKKHAAVLVAGSWGTALAQVLADNENEVKLWTRNEAQKNEINNHHTNEKYLPNVRLSSGITATCDIAEAVSGAGAVLLVPPSSAMREVATAIRPHLAKGTLLLHATKGLETGSLKRMSEVIAESLPHIDSSEIVVLSGPSHAEEVIMRSPTAVVVAAKNAEAAEKAQDLFINCYFRVYTNPDVLGVEMSGALKNIIALGAGMSDGLGFGDNAKAALVTRGLAEIARLGAEIGANPLTFAGLAGIGDLVVTSTSKHSRNWRAGYMLAQGKSLQQVLAEMGMVVEGIRTTEAVHQLAAGKNVSMPITAALYQVLFAGKDPRSAVEELMGRGKTREIEEIARKAKLNWLL
ncbi:MAG TPA: NAD(P)H-dependent glycerol-3-phosphate dehydrogenase [Bacilli bacterium]